MIYNNDHSKKYNNLSKYIGKLFKLQEPHVSTCKEFHGREWRKF